MSDTQPRKNMTVIDRGTEGDIIWVTAASPMYGAVNGYVRVPDGHPWHGLDYNDIDVDAPGGLTYGDGDWIGFDTLHYNDYWPDSPFGPVDGDTEWTPALVAAETAELAKRVRQAATA